jgi:hypothetical protein
MGMGDETGELHEFDDVFFRMEYGSGEIVDVDAAGDDAGLDPVRVEAAGTLHPMRTRYRPGGFRASNWSCGMRQSE